MVTDLVEAIRATDADKLILDGTGIGPPRCGVDIDDTERCENHAAEAVKPRIINQSIKTHLYSTVCRKRIRGTRWAGLGRVFTFSVRSVKQISFQNTSETIY